MPENDARRAKVEAKVNELTERVNALKDARLKYARLDICAKVNARLGNRNEET